MTSNSRTLAKQQELLLDAEQYVKDEIYQEAVLVLTKAAGYRTPQTESIRKFLAEIYLKMGYPRKYLEILLEIIGDGTLCDNIYYEAVVYLYDDYQYAAAFQLLKDGLSRLDAPKLKTLYRQIRYKTYEFYGQYDLVQSFQNGLAPVLKDGKWGYLSNQNELIIDYKFDYATHFCGELALVINNGRTTLVNRQGFNAKVADFNAEEILGVSENRAGVKIDNKWFFIDTEFNITVDHWNKLGSYRNGITAVSQGLKWGIRDRQGRLLLNYVYDDIILDQFHYCFINGVNFVQNDGSYYLIDINGETVSENRWHKARAFSSSGYAAVEKEGKWGFVNTQGQECLPFVWQDARSFNNGLAAVRINGKWGFINQYGEVVIGAVYQDVKSFSEGIAAVKSGNSWTFIGLEEFRPARSVFAAGWER